MNCEVIVTEKIDSIMLSTAWVPHQCRSSIAIKAGRREVPDLNPGRACRLSRSEFSTVFTETRVNTD